MPAEIRPGATRVLGYVLAAVLSLVAGFQLGRWTDDPEAAAVAPHAHPVQAEPGAEVGGLAVSAGGYTIVPEGDAFTAGQAGMLRFRIVAPDGVPVTSYATVHERPMHLIVARRDLTGYQHLHPDLDTTGVWSTPLTLGAAGSWRAFADFSVVGGDGAQTALTLGTDLTVPGTFQPEDLPPAVRESTVNDLTVTYSGEPRPSTSVPLTFRVTRDTTTAALEPYLGSYGHLVVLREGDVGYVHVHAEPAASAGQARFWLTVPSPGRYRMFFDFKVTGEVHMASFVLEVA